MPRSPKPLTQDDARRLLEEAMTLGQRIKAARLTRGWTQRQLAKAVGVTHGLVGQWEKDNIKDLRLPNLYLLSDRLNYSARWLAIGDAPPDRAEPRTTQEVDMLDIFRSNLPDDRQEILETAKRWRARAKLPA